jgi:hypothetical protein
LVCENLADPTPAESAAAWGAIDRGVVARPVHVVARVLRAYVLVIAHDPFTEILFADARYAEARTAIEVALRSVVQRRVVARTARKVTNVPGAFVAIVAQDASAPDVLFARAGYADADEATEVAIRPVDHRLIRTIATTPRTRIPSAPVPGAFVAVVAVFAAFAARAEDRADGTPTQKSYADRADT